jgi:methyl-accepting chemotaxis protein
LSTITNFIDKTNILTDSLDNSAKFLVKSSDNLTMSFNNSTLEIQQAINAIKNIFLDFKNHQNNLNTNYINFNNLFEGTLTSMKGQNDIISNTWAGYETRFSSLDQSLEKAFTSINDGYLSFVTQSQGYLKQLDQSLGQALNNLSAVISEFSDSAKNYSEILEKIANTDNNN